MILEIPRYREYESSYELEEFRDPVAPMKEGSFHTKNKKCDYSSLINAVTRDKIKK